MGQPGQLPSQHGAFEGQGVGQPGQLPSQDGTFEGQGVGQPGQLPSQDGTIEGQGVGQPGQLPSHMVVAPVLMVSADEVLIIDPIISIARMAIATVRKVLLFFISYLRLD